MELYVLDQNFNNIYFTDYFESLLWIDKFYEPGTFEFYSPVTSDILRYLTPGNYLSNPDSDRMMIIEDFSIEYDREKGNYVKIVGRDLSSILDRRIIWKRTIFEKKKIQDVIERLLNDNIIGPDSNHGGNSRKISNFKFNKKDDLAFNNILITAQYEEGENLLSIIEDICKTKKVGFKISLDAWNNLIFELCLGKNRGYSQSVNSFVVFNPEFDNVMESNYIEKNSSHRNVALVVGDEENDAKRRIVGGTSGIFRKEMYINASDINSNEIGTGESYVKALDERGKNELKNYRIRKEFSAKCDITKQFIYGRDFFLGDIVQVGNEYGIEDNCRITEFTMSYGPNNCDAYPTFTSINDGTDETTESTDVVNYDYFDYLEQTKKLSTSKTTVFTFTSVNIKENSLFDIYCSIYRFTPSSVVATEGKVVVTFPTYTSAVNLTVRLYIKK